MKYKVNVEESFRKQFDISSTIFLNLRFKKNKDLKKNTPVILFKPL